MAEDNPRALEHIYLSNHGERQSFTSPRIARSSLPIPYRNRARHAEELESALLSAIESADASVLSQEGLPPGRQRGYFLEFRLPKAQAPAIDSLEYRRGADKIELLAVREVPDDPASIAAAVFIPESKRDFFLKKVREYAREDRVTYEKDLEGNFILDQDGNQIEKHRRPKNQSLVASVNSVRIAYARSLYTDEQSLFPSGGEQRWWEVWLRAGTFDEFSEAAEQVAVELRPHLVTFAEREVVLALATPEEIDRLVSSTYSVAELRLARDTPAVFMEMSGSEQNPWVQDAINRIVAPPDEAPAVCILDTGSTHRHPLIRLSLNVSDMHAFDPAWSPEDTGAYGGHGTEMSGIALYGDLVPILTGRGLHELRHRLESVKVLPDTGANHPDLYGYITAQAISRVEIAAPLRQRAICMAITANGDHWRGRPSSWSAAIDQLAYGDGSDQRLIVLSAGNIREKYPPAEYLVRNDLAPIESPAQSWNALTVGAYSEKQNVLNPDFRGWAPLGHAGDLCPVSRTSVSWLDDSAIKPDVVSEGGNYAINPGDGSWDGIDDLSLLTTFRRPEERPLTTTGDTSAAAAQVASIGAQILADKPHLWPETVRALIVHSAEWTRTMTAHLSVNSTASERRTVLRRYGYGVPDLSRALRSMNSDVTIVVESTIQPFDGTVRPIKTKDMRFHEFPWPVDSLRALDETVVQMKVTLSYFIEPNPGERGWTSRHRYASHGLRFAVKNSLESVQQFKRRINRAARQDDEDNSGIGSEPGWSIGQRLRDRGSIHSDVWEGTASELADKHAIGVFPVGGWWREKPALNRADRMVRYSLVVSLRAPIGIDLYTSIESAIAATTEISV